MASPDDDLKRWFDGLPKKVQSKLGAVVKSEANDLSAAQITRLKSLERPPDDTGALEASCKVELGKSEAEVTVVAGGDLTTKLGYDHAMAFEFGTVKQPARSFFWSTYRERASGIRQRLEDAIAKAVNE